MLLFINERLADNLFERRALLNNSITNLNASRHKQVPCAAAAALYLGNM